MRADLGFKQRQGFWETPRNIAIVLTAVAAIAGFPGVRLAEPAAQTAIIEQPAARWNTSDAGGSPGRPSQRRSAQASPSSSRLIVWQPYRPTLGNTDDPREPDGKAGAIQDSCG